MGSRLKADLQRELEKLMRRVRDDAAPAAVRAGLAVLENGVKRRAPVGKTHELRESIHPTEPETHGSVVSGSVVVDSDHAAAVEFGTSRQAAEPFVRPAADEDGEAAARAVARALGAKL
jgi:HK97 gp10 family phage protein